MGWTSWTKPGRPLTFQKLTLHLQSGKVSYLVYPDFETDPHPALQRSVKLSLRTREIDCFDYTTSTNPPILHHKETFLTTDHPLHAKFARLTQQEEKYGLLDDTATIGTKEGWQARLSALGLCYTAIDSCGDDTRIYAKAGKKPRNFNHR
jgi:DNA phosphorothioation-associated putative methyltransferase